MGSTMGDISSASNRNAAGGTLAKSSEPDDEGKVPKRFWAAHQTPVVLESDDEVEFEMNRRATRIGGLWLPISVLADSAAGNC